MLPILRRLSWLLRRRRKESELRDEIAFHLEAEAEERKAAGLSSEDAQFAAQRDLGSVALVTEVTRATWGWPMIEQFLQDLTYAMRTLFRNPGFTAAAVAPIALGIGVNTGIFSILDAVALRSLAVPQSTQLVAITQRVRGAERYLDGAPSMVSVPEYESYRERAQTLSGLMGYSAPRRVTLGVGAPREVAGELVTCDYFDVLRVKPVIGAGFKAANCEVGSEPSVILSHDLWTTAFAGDPGILNENITLNRQQFAVVGIAPEDFHGVGLLRAAFFAPVSTLTALRPDQKHHLDANMSWLLLIARRRSEADLDKVRAELAVISRQIDQQQPGRTTVVNVEPATLLPFPEARRDVLNVASVVLAAFGLVLLVACANVANLLLARAAGRAKEIAVRLSIGASRGRLIRQLLTEGLVVAIVGGAAGSLVAWWSFQGILVAVVSSLPGALPVPNLDVHPSINVFWFGLLLTAATALAFGLVPALQSSKPDIQIALKQEGVALGRAQGGWLRGSLIGVQVAVSTVLLISAGLLGHALYAAHRVDPGFEYHNVTVVSFDLRGAGYDQQKTFTFQRQLRERIAALPGVDAVAHVDRTPLSPGRTGTMMRLPGRDQWHEIDVTTVSPEYFSLVGIPIVRGRSFTAGDLSDTPRSIIVTQATARRYWPNQDPIGQTISMYEGPKQEVTREVVGVTSDAQVAHIGEIESSYMYLPAGPQTQRGLNLLVRSPDGFAALAGSIRAAARELDPALVVRVNRLEENLDFWRSISRLVASLTGSLSALALVLAVVGVYGVVSYVVSRQLREVGIRMMLGATAHEVYRIILGQTLRPISIGLVVGLAAAAVSTRVLRTVLFGISPIDPMTFTVAPLFLLGVAIAASLPSIRRAVRLDPMTILRYE